MHATAEGETAFFWQAAGESLGAVAVETGTMMGFPCLRVNGAFFACCERRSGDLIVKLPSTRVQELIAAGDGQPFAPAGKVFREWVLVAERDLGRWRVLIGEARSFVTGESATHG